MDREEIARKFETLKVWQRGDEELLTSLCWFCMQLARYFKARTDYSPILRLMNSLEDFCGNSGRSGKQYHPEFPFWRLQNDGVWEIPGADSLVESSNGDVRRGDLFRFEVAGGFTEDIARQLQDDSSMVQGIVQNMLEAHFPDSIHEDILQATGLDLTLRSTGQQKRDPNFRVNILKAYEYRCAVCGFDVRLGLQPVALEAAHIKWRQAGGPDLEVNGLALCSLHHKLFDRGAFTLSSDLEIFVSDDAHGTEGF